MDTSDFTRGIQTPTTTNTSTTNTTTDSRTATSTTTAMTTPTTTTRSTGPSIEQQVEGLSILIRQKLERENQIKHWKKIQAENGGSLDEYMKDLGEPPDWAHLLTKVIPVRSVKSYEKLKFLGDGSYSSVYKVKDKKSGQIFAMKKIKSRSNNDTNISLTTFRELKFLIASDHPNILRFHEICVHPDYKNEISIVTEFCDIDLLELMRSRGKQKLEKKHVKSFTFQLFSALSYLHHKNILHRDIKLSNLMVTKEGDIKLGDFGLARGMFDESSSTAYTPLVATLWYRAPELLLGSENYDASIDIWAAGCLFGELLAATPLFPGKSELDQLDIVFRHLGTPTDDTWPGYKSLPSCQVIELPFKPPDPNFRGKFFPEISDTDFDFLKKCLMLNPKNRITASGALQHPIFTEIPLAEKYNIDLEAEKLHNEKATQKQKKMLSFAGDE